jgi:hypothetical protein
MRVNRFQRISVDEAIELLSEIKDTDQSFQLTANGSKPKFIKEISKIKIQHEQEILEDGIRIEYKEKGEEILLPPFRIREEDDSVDFDCGDSVYLENIQ